MVAKPEKKKGVDQGRAGTGAKRAKDLSVNLASLQPLLCSHCYFPHVRKITLKEGKDTIICWPFCHVLSTKPGFNMHGIIQLSHTCMTAVLLFSLYRQTNRGPWRQVACQYHREVE